MAELLDHAEHVVPAPGVQAGRVLAQLPEDLVHLERSQDRLDQHGRPDRSRGRTPARPPRGRRRRSRGAPRDGSRASAGRGTGPRPCPGAAARCGRGRDRSRRGSPRPARRRARDGAPRGASPGAARAVSRPRRSAGSACRGVSSSIVPSIASVRFAWPSSMLAQVGEFASSKSAMNMRAPELRALITIFRSVGPVISTRRSRSGSGTGSIVQSPSRISRVSGRKSGSSPAASRCCCSARVASSSRRRGPKRPSSSSTNAVASSVRTPSTPVSLSRRARPGPRLGAARGRVRRPARSPRAP